MEIYESLMLLKQTQAIISARLPTGLAKLKERDISMLLVRSKYFRLCFNSTTGLYRGDFAVFRPGEGEVGGRWGRIS